MASYACPMHPDVQRDRAADCPKCGMKLVKKDDNAKNESKDEHAPRRKSLLWRWQ
jgi:hypothetical protein